MKKNIKRVGIILLVIVFAILFKGIQSEAVIYGEKDDKFLVSPKCCIIDEKDVLLVSPNKSYLTADPDINDEESPNKLYVEELNELLVPKGIDLNTVQGEKDLQSELATGDVIEYDEDSELLLIIAGDADCNGSICNNDYTVVVNDYLKFKTANDIQKLAANVYDEDDRLNVFDINRMNRKYLYNDADTLIYSWSSQSSGGEDPIPGGEYRISVNLDKKYLSVNETAKVTYKITPDTADQSVTFSSSNSQVATVDQSGNVTAKSAGTADITVQSNRYQDSGTGKYLSGKVTVIVDDAVHVTGIKISVEGITKVNGKNLLSMGETATVTATVTPDNARFKNVMWISSNKDILTVGGNGNQATITPIKPGTATIKAWIQEENKYSGEIEITVPDEILIKSLHIDGIPANNKITKGNNVELTVTTTPSNATEEINWTSSDDNKATVTSRKDEEGKVIVTIVAKTAGNVTISYNTPKSNISGSIEFEVVEAQE